MLEISNPGHEAELGLDLSEVYGKSDLAREMLGVMEERHKPAADAKPLDYSELHVASAPTQFLVNLQRFFRMYWRSPEYNLTRYGITLLVGFVFGSLFWRLGDNRTTVAGVFNIMGVLYSSTLFVGISNCLSVQHVVAVQRAVMYRERAAGTYGVLPFSLAQQLVEIPYILVQSIVYCAIVYWMIWFARDAAKFFWFLFYFFLTLSYFTFFGVMNTCLTPTVAFANVLSSFFFGFFNLLSGFIIPQPFIPGWWIWAFWANPVMWTLYGMIVSQLGDYTNEYITDLNGNTMTIPDFLVERFFFKHSMLGPIVAILCTRAGTTGMQTLDLDQVTKVEARGNQVILTMGSQDDSEPEPALDEATVMDAVVKIFCVHTEPNYSLPWQRKRQYASTSSGFIIAGENGERWLLTNAHSVEYYSQVKVKRRADDRKFLARVLAIGTECDVALLTVDDEEFWQGVEAVRFGQLPTLQDSVFVVGYPIGGDTISVTSGVVSRIEVTAYAHGATELLGVQIDAAINSGNSGGPVFNEMGLCVGIAFQSYAGSDAENIGYVIPTPVIDHFLDDFKRNGTFTAFPALGIQWQRMESAALRAACGMREDMKGVLIRSVYPCSHAYGRLLPGDILMSFDGVQVACDGTVPFRTGERIAFGDVANVGILRNGQPMTVQLELMRPNSLVPHHLHGRDPSFLVVAGIVFTVLTAPYLHSEYGEDFGREAPVRLLEKLLLGKKRFPEEAVVVVSQVLACDATIGYEDWSNVQVHSFNGTPVRNLRHLAEMVLACKEPYMRFDVDYDEVIILESAAARAATEEMLQLHSIPNIVSKDLLDLLPSTQHPQPPPQQHQQPEQQQEQDQLHAADQLLVQAQQQPASQQVLP
ncbi:hypothetical protein N2152v2_004661 [Parachlorella kessleri]